jgi:hypothetical protein
MWGVPVTFRRIPRLWCAVLIVAFSHTSLPVRAQSLVDVARVTREMRERHGPPTKVYTNADLPNVGVVPVSPEPTAPSVSFDRLRLDAALERERALLERLRTQEVTRPDPLALQPTPPSPKPPPTQTTSGIPLSLAYAGTPVIAARPHKSSRRESTLKLDPDLNQESTRPHQWRSRGRDRRTRHRPTVTQTDGGTTIEPTAGRPAASSGYDVSARPFPYTARGIPVPGLYRNGPPSGATIQRHRADRADRE